MHFWLHGHMTLFGYHPAQRWNVKMGVLIIHKNMWWLNFFIGLCFVFKVLPRFNNMHHVSDMSFQFRTYKRRQILSGRSHGLKRKKSFYANTVGKWIFIFDIKYIINIQNFEEVSNVKTCFGVFLLSQHSYEYFISIILHLVPGVYIRHFISQCLTLF